MTLKSSVEVTQGAIPTLGAVSYSFSILTMALSYIICGILRAICRKSRNVYTLPVFRAPEKGDPVAISRRRLMLIN